MRAYKGIVENGVVVVIGARLPEGTVVTVTVGETELLRARIFKLERATNIRGQKHGHVDKESLLQYMTIWEYASDELPWEVLVYLGSSERWRHYVEGHYMVSPPWTSRCPNTHMSLQKWEIAQYLVTRKYSKTGGNDPAIRSTASL